MVLDHVIYNLLTSMWVNIVTSGHSSSSERMGMLPDKCTRNDDINMLEGTTAKFKDHGYVVDL